MELGVPQFHLKELTYYARKLLKSVSGVLSAPTLHVHLVRAPNISQQTKAQPVSCPFPP